MIETLLSMYRAAGHEAPPVPERRFRDVPDERYVGSMDLALPTSSGESVTERTALNIAAVFGAVRLLAEVEASLPCHLYRRRTTGAGRDKATDSYLYSFVHDAPNDEMSAFLYRLYMRQNRALWGNAYALPVWNKGGRLDALWPLRPDLMQVYRNVNGNKMFEYDNGDAGSMLGGTKVSGKYLYNEIIHVRGIGDDLVGYSPIKCHREGLGLALATQKFGASFFRNGAKMSGILELAGKVKNLDVEREKFEAAYAGASKAGKTLVIDQGSKFVATSIPPEDAQYLGTRAFERVEIYALMYGIPPSMMGDVEKQTSFGAGVEQMVIGFKNFNLGPSLEMAEQEHNLKLLGRGSDLFIEHALDGLLRGDAKTRAEVNATKRQNGAINANEWRAQDNENPIEGPDGEVYLVNGTMIPVSAAGQKPEPTAAPAPAA